MQRRRGIGILVAVGGALLIAAGLAAWTRTTSEARRLDYQRTAREDSARVIRSEIIQTKLRYQAFQKSIPTLPDTMRTFGAGKLIERGKVYSKQIYRLEHQESDLKLESTWLKRRADRARARATATSIPLGVAGLILLLGGLVLARTARARPVGA